MKSKFIVEIDHDDPKVIDKFKKEFETALLKVKNLYIPRHVLRITQYKGKPVIIYERVKRRWWR